MTEIVLKMSFEELSQLEGITEAIILEVVEHGIAEPIAGETLTEWVFDTTSVHWVKKAVRLYYDFEIDWIAVAMVIDLLQQKEQLQKENERFQQQIQRFYLEE